MPGRAIPNDWIASNGYVCLSSFVPNSPMWRGTVRGLYLDLLDAWRWDKETGSPSDAVLVSSDIFDSVTFGGCMTPQVLVRVASAISVNNLNVITFATVDYDPLSQWVPNNQGFSPLQSGMYIVGCNVGLRVFTGTNYLRVFLQDQAAGKAIVVGRWFGAQELASHRRATFEQPVYLVANELYTFNVEFTQSGSLTVDSHPQSTCAWVYRL